MNDESMDETPLLPIAFPLKSNKKNWNIGSKRYIKKETQTQRQRTETENEIC